VSLAPARSLWRIGPAEGALLVENADLVLAELPYFLGDWPIRWAGGDAAAPDIGIRQESGQFVVAGPGPASETFPDAFGAANGLAGALVAGLVGRDPDLVCAHAGTAEVAGRLVAVLGDSFAGKSSLERDDFRLQRILRF
jgi:hypothetical protein